MLIIWDTLPEAHISMVYFHQFILLKPLTEYSFDR